MEHRRHVTIITVDDDTHGCYIDGVYAGHFPFLGLGAITAFEIMAQWLGCTSNAQYRSPEQFERMGGNWPGTLALWGTLPDA